MSLIRQLQGAALCWNPAHENFYDAACHTIARNNFDVPSEYQYQCFGILPGKFYEYLYAGGERVCVCKFYSATGVDPWTYQGEWGVCNGACTSAYFDCDGSVPIALNSPTERSMSAMSVSNVSTSTSVSSTSAPGAAAEDSEMVSSAAAHVAGPFSTSVKGLMVATLLTLRLMLA